MLTRLSVFTALLGLIVLIPAFFVPAMLMANAMDGAQYLSIWAGIRTFYERQLYFLASLIFICSVIFPVLKFSLVIASAGFGGRLPAKWRLRIIHLTEATAKYSMLDVYVIALLLLLVKVNEYVRLYPSLGLYLFSFAVFCSIVSSGLLRRAIAREHLAEAVSPEAAGPLPGTQRFKIGLWRRLGHLPWIIVGGIMLASGLHLSIRYFGGETDRVIIKNLTKRPIPRSFEKMMGLRPLVRSGESLSWRESAKRLLETFTAATTDAGWKTPSGLLVVQMNDGLTFSLPGSELNFEDPNLEASFPLPQSVSIQEIASVELRSKVEFLGLLPSEVSEERLEAANDTLRRWNRDWYGRIFQFHFSGKEYPERNAGFIIGSVGLLGLLWGLSGLLSCGRSTPKTPHSHPSP
jgi:paraquat-inducible protein A